MKTHMKISIKFSVFFSHYYSFSVHLFHSFLNSWQNALNSPSELEPHPDAWLIGALRMACESSTYPNN